MNKLDIQLLLLPDVNYFSAVVKNGSSLNTTIHHLMF